MSEQRTHRLHERLVADSHIIGTFPQATVLLHRNAAVSWFMLVPDTDITEFLDLSSGLQQLLIAYSKRTADFVRTYFGAQKINFAAIGNIVPQIHCHVIGRNPGDSCWPNPVWGHLLEEKAYSDADIAAIRTAMVAQCDISAEALILRKRKATSYDETWSGHPTLHPWRSRQSNRSWRKRLGQNDDKSEFR